MRFYELVISRARRATGWYLYDALLWDDIYNKRKMYKFETENGYSSDDFVANGKVKVADYCQFCKVISGPRVGFGVHLATRQI